MSGRDSPVAVHARAGEPGGRRVRLVVTAVAAVLSGTAAACASPADRGEVTPAASSVSPPDRGGDVTEIRAEVQYRAADDLPVTRVAVGLGSDVELVITGNPSGPVHLRGYQRYAEVVGASTVLQFVATEPGCFVVEHDETGRAIAEVEVIDPDPADAAQQSRTRPRPRPDPSPRPTDQCAARG